MAVPLSSQIILRENLHPVLDPNVLQNISWPEYYRFAWLASNAAAPSSPFGTIVDATGPTADFRMRNLTQKNTLAVPPQLHMKAQQLSYHLFVSNPLAKRIIDLRRDYVVGDGIEFRAESPEVQDILDSFWYEDENNWESRILMFAQDLSVFGEQLYTFGMDPITGFLSVQDINPLNIKAVVTSPLDRSRVETVFLKEDVIDAESSSVKEKLATLKIIRKALGEPIRTGDALFFRVNDVSYSGRGLPDLFSIVDWLYVLDSFVYNVSEKMEYLNRWFWDVTLEGATEPDIKKFKETISANPPKPGSYNIHNEFVKWAPVSPNQGMDDVSGLIKELRNVILTGAGLNSILVGDPSTTLGRQATPELLDSAFRSLKVRQRVIKSAVMQFFNYQLDSKLAVGALDPKVDRRISIFMPRIAVRDLQRLGGVVQRIASAVGEAVEQGLISDEEGSLVLRAILDEMGLGMHLKTSMKSKPSKESLSELVKTRLEESEQWQHLVAQGAGAEGVTSLLEKLDDFVRNETLRRDFDLVK